MASNMIDWNAYYNSFNESREAEKAAREQADALAKTKVNQLVGDVEREGMKAAEKGKTAKRAELDVSNYDSLKNAKTAYDTFYKAQNPTVAKTGWEAQLNMGRQEGEQANPWSKLGERLTGVQGNINRVNQQTRLRQRDAEMQAAKDAFNKRSKEIMANDEERRGTAAEQNAKFAAALDKYAEQARQQEKSGRKVVTSPYAQAMADCNAGTGPCPANMTTTTGVASSQDPNHLSSNGQVELTRAQEELKRRLESIREDEGFSYGTGTDATSWF